MILKPTDSGTRWAVKRFDLTPAKRIGRGMFAVVYAHENNRVLKLSTDAVQGELIRNYAFGPHYPVLHENHGIVSKQSNGLDLWLFELERLRSLRYADAPTRKLAKLVMTIKYKSINTNAYNTARGKRGVAGWLGESSVMLQQMENDTRLPLSIREALNCIYQMSSNGLQVHLDMSYSNFMVRGTDELILNDVICDGNLLYNYRHLQ